MIVAWSEDVGDLVGKIQVGGGFHPTIEIEVFTAIGQIRHRAQYHPNLMVWHGIDFIIGSAFGAPNHNPIAYTDDHCDKDDAYRH